tara:strand:- start:473 stop:1621 length:1149 start_codon:yes stop_codon:yes gene_type:complete
MLKFLLTIFLILITSCHTHINENVSKDVESRMQKFMVDKKISGAVTLAYHKGNIIHHQATGFANISTKEKMTTESLFRIASLTKNVTAISVMILQDRGKLSVNDKVSKHIPEYANLKVKDSNQLADLRIRHLMSHTSGIILPRNDDGSMTLKQVAVAGTSKPLIFTPGSQWKYSRGLDVCAYIVENVSGSPFSDFLDKEIFLPLQMKDTGFYLNEEQVKRLVISYQPSKDGKHIIPSTLERLVKPPVGKFTPGPSGGLISSAQDMGRFYQMLLNGGELDGKRIVSETSAKIIRQSQTGENKAGFVPGSAWGLGFGLVQQPVGVSAMLNEGSFGHGGAFGTQGWVDPITETVYVLMIQRTKFGNSDASDVRLGFQQAVAEGIK